MGISHSIPTTTIRCKSVHGCAAELVIPRAGRWADIATELAHHRWAVVKQGEHVPLTRWRIFCPAPAGEAEGPP